LKVGERGFEVLLQEEGHETETQPWGDPKRARKMPGRLLVLGTTVSPTAHWHPTDYAPFTTPVTSNHQYASIPSQVVPVLVPRGQRPSERGVAREFGPCSELMMSDKLESEVEFALVLGVGKWRA